MSADVLLLDSGKLQLQFIGLTIQAAFQDGFDALVGTGSKTQCSAAGIDGTNWTQRQPTRGSNRSSGNRARQRVPRHPHDQL